MSFGDDLKAAAAKLSPTMTDALARIRAAPDGTIRYYPGGWWSAPAYELGEPGRFVWSTSKGTVVALARRGLLVEAARHPKHRFICAYRLAERLDESGEPRDALVEPIDLEAP